MVQSGGWKALVLEPTLLKCMTPPPHSVEEDVETSEGMAADIRRSSHAADVGTEDRTFVEEDIETSEGMAAGITRSSHR